MYRTLLTGLFLSTAAQAADLGVLPVVLNLDGTTTRTAVTVTNRGNEAVAIQVESVAWRQNQAGRDEYQLGSDLLVNPPLFTIPAGGTQVLRVGLRRAPEADRETAYRLFLRELPPSSPTTSSDGAQVRVLLELRLPVYVRPAKISRSQSWHAKRLDAGVVEATVFNEGNVHLKVLELRVQGPDAAAPLAATKTNSVVFPAQSRSWRLQMPAGDPPQPLALKVLTDQGSHDVALDPDRQ